MLSCSGERWTTTTKTMPVSAGIFVKNSCKGLMQPAEPPSPTTGSVWKVYAGTMVSTSSASTCSALSAGSWEASVSSPEGIGGTSSEAEERVDGTMGVV